MKSKDIFILTNIEIPTRSHIISLAIRKDKMLRCYRRSRAGKGIFKMDACPSNRASCFHFPSD